MLRMTKAEVKLRAGSQLTWRHHVYDAAWMLTVNVEIVRLLAVVGNRRNGPDESVFRVRVRRLSDGKIHDVDPHYLVDPTRLQ